MYLLVTDAIAWPTRARTGITDNEDTVSFNKRAQRLDAARVQAGGTGFFAAEALKPYDRFTAAAAEIAAATVDGKPPQLDPYSLEPVFHYPDEDVDFLASVTRTFMRDAEDIRITLQHVTELELIAARRVSEALKRTNVRWEEARILVERTARQARSETANFVTLLSSDSEITKKVSDDQLRECADAVRTDAKKCSDGMRQRLSAIPQFQDPLNLSDLSEDEILEYDVVFIPGGYGPMVDLPDNADVRRLLDLPQFENMPSSRARRIAQSSRASPGGNEARVAICTRPSVFM